MQNKFFLFVIYFYGQEVCMTKLIYLKKKSPDIWGLSRNQILEKEYDQWIRWEKELFDDVQSIKVFNPQNKKEQVLQGAMINATWYH